MIPKSLSASSILVSEACSERWKVENFWRSPQMTSDPAGVGTSCHFAFEHFVKAVYLDKTHEWDDVKLLTSFYNMGYMDTFNTGNYDTDQYRDGAELVAKWYERNKQGLANEVLAVETKEAFEIKTHAGMIPFNYIFDRLDKIDDEVYEVVDYKSLRAFIRPEDLKEKIQPRAYALATQIKFPQAQRIWVTFDMLRHEPVGVVFTRDENAQTYRYLQRAANRIIDIDEDDTVETLNSECKWCIKKGTCETLLSANKAGSMVGLTGEELAQKKLEIAAQLLALKYADEEVDKLLCLEAENRDEIEWDAGANHVNITARKMRKPNSNAIAHIVGEELCKKYGNFTMTNVDKMMNSGDLTDEQKAAVNECIKYSWTEPSAKVKPITPFEEQ